MRSKKKLFCSFSSGLSSAMMAKILLDEYRDEYDIIFGFANTGKENEESLIFADKCDNHFGLNLVWIEADIDIRKNKGTKHVVKSFDTATRGGALFEKGIQKYGIPNVANKWCNRELKLNAIHSYLKSIGWGNFGKDYYTAIGIRADEMDRISVNKDRDKLIYPLIERGLTSRDRNRFWSNMPFTLNLKGYQGNCDLCFEKSNRKLATIYLENKNKIKWWQEMESKYSSISIDGKSNYNSREKNYFLRENNPFDTIIELSKQRFSKATDEYVYENDLFDLEGGCGNGCNFY